MAYTPHAQTTDSKHEHETERTGVVVRERPGVQDDDDPKREQARQRRSQASHAEAAPPLKYAQAQERSDEEYPRGANVPNP